MANKNASIITAALELFLRKKKVFFTPTAYKYKKIKIIFYNNYGGPTFSQLAIIVKLIFSNRHLWVFESSSHFVTYNFLAPGSQSKHLGLPP